MRITKTVREIGLFEGARNISEVMDYMSVAKKVGAEMPLPAKDISAQIQEVSNWLLEFGKTRYIFLTPEIALIEEMAKQTNRSFEAVIIAPADMDIESRERMNNNIPRFEDHPLTILVTVIEEHSFGIIYPSDTMFVTCGYECGGRMMVMTDTYRLVQENDKFYGKKAFVPYVSLGRYNRYKGWIEARADKLNVRWRA